MKTISYKIKNNDDWANLKQDEILVDISNDSYFGFRAMEKGAKEIIYDPTLVSSLVRVCKEGKKFPNTTHNLILSKLTIGFESSKSEENFLKDSTRVIETVLEINPDIKLDFTIDCDNLDVDFIYATLRKIYN